jgi:hypothetical protein
MSRLIIEPGAIEHNYRYLERLFADDGISRKLVFSPELSRYVDKEINPSTGKQSA